MRIEKTLLLSLLLSTISIFTSPSFAQFSMQNCKLTYSQDELDSIRTHVKTRSTLVNNVTTSHVFRGKYSSYYDYDFNSNYFRVPGAYITNKGTIIGLSEVRHYNYNDFQPYISIGLARSTNDGGNWTNKVELLNINDWKLGGDLAGYIRVMQPSIFQDTTNRIYVFGDIINDNRNPESVNQSEDLNYDIIYKTSDDDGITWSDAVSLRKENPSLFSGVGFNQILIGDCHSIVMHNGTAVIPIYVRTTSSNINNQLPPPYLCQSGFIYSATPSDPKSWKMSTLIPQFTSESAIAEYEEGKLMINCRSEIAARRIFYTEDMGNTWAAHISDKKLPEPLGCQASITTKDGIDGKIGFFCNPNSNSVIASGWDGRKNITVKVSTNFKDWFVLQNIIPSATDGYSDIFYRNGKLVVIAEADKAYYRGGIDCYVLSNLADEDLINKITGNLHLSIPTATIYLNGSNQSTYAQVKCNTNWTAHVDNDWLSISKDSFYRNDSILVTATPNPTVSERKGYISINGDGLKEQQIEFIQAPGDTVVYAKQNSISLNKENYLHSQIDIKANTDWNSTCDASWIHLTSASGLGDGTINLVADKNESDTIRKTIIHLMANGTERQTIQVLQDAADTILKISDPELAVENDSASTTSFDILSNTTWSINLGCSWIQVDKLSGENNDKIIITADKNLELTKRSAYIEVSGTGVPKKTIIITQNAGLPYISIPTDSVLLSNCSNASGTITVNSNVHWTASTDANWLKLYTDGTSGKIKVYAERNTELIPRETTISVKTDNQEKEIKVTQKGADIIFVIDNEDSIYNLNMDSILYIHSNAPWTVKSDVKWINLTVDSINGYQELHLISDENTEADNRYGTLSFYYDNNLIRSCRIMQQGPNIILITSVDSLIFDSTHSEKTIDIESNHICSISSNKSWVKFNDQTWSGNRSIIISAEQNKSVKERSALIKIEAGGLRKFIQITQAGAKAYIRPKVSAIRFAKIKEAKSVEIESNTSIRVESNQDWVKMNVDSADDSYTLSLTVVENSSATMRSATISISSDSVETQSIVITQEGLGEATNIDNTISTDFNIYPNPAKDHFTIKSAENMIVEISILSANGKTLLNGEYHTNNPVSVDNIPIGTYILEIKNNKLISTKKLIIKR